MVASPSEPGLSEPCPGRRMAAAGFTVGGDDVVELHAEAEEFRQRRHLVEGRPVLGEKMDVGGDRVGQKAARQHGARGFERERAHAMTDIEQDAALTRLDDLGPDRSLHFDRRIGKRPEGMRQHIARPQACRRPRDRRAAARRHGPSAAGRSPRPPRGRSSEARYPGRPRHAGRRGS